MKKYLFIILSIVAITVQAQTSSPTVISTAGSSTKTTAVTLSYTVGELMVTTLKQDSIRLTQGSNQPTKVSVVGIENIEPNRFSVQAYPNPTSELLNISITKKNENDTFDYSVIDIYGKSLKLLITTMPDKTQINTAALPSGEYIVRVVNKSTQKASSIKILIVH